jgi:hypothetical protein
MKPLKPLSICDRKAFALLCDRLTDDTNLLRIICDRADLSAKSKIANHNALFDFASITFKAP